MLKKEELKFTSIISVAKNLHKWVFFVNSQNFRVHDDENFARINNPAPSQKQTTQFDKTEAEGVSEIVSLRSQR
jgi:hypothetical protein